MISDEQNIQFHGMLDSLERGALFWKWLTGQALGSPWSCYVFLFSEDDAVNHYTVHYLPAFRKKNSVSDFLIVTGDPKVAGMVRREAAVPYTLHEISGSLREDICRFLAVYYEQFEFKRIIINGTCFPQDHDVFRLLGVHGISKKDIVAVSVLGLERPLGEDQLRNLKDSVVSVPYKPIPWEEANQQLFFDGDVDTLAFEEFVEVGIKRLQRENKITPDDRIVLCTTTKTTCHIIAVLQGYQVVAVIDNNPQKAGQLWAGIPVYQTDEFLKEHSGEDYKFIVPTRSYRVICEQLNFYGYKLHKQVFVTYCRNDYFTPALLEKKITDITAGKQVYDRLRKIYPTERIYICLHPGTGDAFLAGMYMEDVLKNDHATAYIAVSTSQSCKKVLELFGINATVLPRDEAGKLVYFLKLMGAERTNTRILNDDHYYLVGRGLQTYRGLDLHSLFRRMVLGIENARPIPKLRQNNADYLFTTFGLKKGKTVLLSPYSKSAGIRLANAVWEQIAARLMNRGYTVCTNIAPEGEEAIRGTTGMSIPYHVLLDFLDKAGGFIGLRSGLCDVIASSSARKVVIYPTRMDYGSGSFYDYFSLEKMGLAKENLKEVEILPNQQDKIMEAVVQTFHG